MIAAATERFGRLDVLVANAGIIPLGDAQEVTTADWDDVMAIDGRGMFLTCKFGIEAMLATGGGAIVCLSSISGLAGQKRQAAYGPAKFIATGLAKHLAVEWADRGIRVNAVAPGTIRTERVRQMQEEPGGAEYLATVEAMHPMGRVGEPDEVASAIAFLASDDASFITGAVLPSTGVTWRSSVTRNSGARSAVPRVTLDHMSEQLQRYPEISIAPQRDIPDESIRCPHAPHR